MESCKTCALYSPVIDELGRDFNDVGDINNHYCPMYQDAIPEGIFDGQKDCEFHEPKENERG